MHIFIIAKPSVSGVNEDPVSSAGDVNGTADSLDKEKGENSGVMGESSDMKEENSEVKGENSEVKGENSEGKEENMETGAQGDSTETEYVFWRDVLSFGKKRHNSINMDMP